MNVDLTKILKHCPTGTKLYSPIWGEIYFEKVYDGQKYPITTTTKGSCTATFTKEGLHYADENGECVLFPSKEQRDWNKFSAPWYKKEKFNPKTLQSFDKVIVKKNEICKWKVDFYSHNTGDRIFPFRCIGDLYSYCIPYNDDTKYLVGTDNEAPEFYKYWED